MGVDIYREPRMVASNENSAASNEFVSSVGGKSTTGLRRVGKRERERDTDEDGGRTARERGCKSDREEEKERERRRTKLRMKQDVEWVDERTRGRWSEERENERQAQERG